MNALTLTRIKILTDTPADLMQTINDSAIKQKLPGYLETAIYQTEAEPPETFILSFWQSLATVQDAEIQPHLPLNHTQLLSRDIFKMIKDYRLLPAQPTFSRLVLFTVPTPNPHQWIELGKTLFKSGIEEWQGLVRCWFGRSLHEPENTLLLLLRLDWRSEPEQQLYLNSPKITRFLHHLKSEGGTVQTANLKLETELPLPEQP